MGRCVAIGRAISDPEERALSRVYLLGWVGFPVSRCYFTEETDLMLVFQLLMKSGRIVHGELEVGGIYCSLRGMR